MHIYPINPFSYLVPQPYQGPELPARLVQRARGLQCKHRLMIGNLVLIYPCCWCSHGYGCVDGLCHISPVLLSLGNKDRRVNLDLSLFHSLES